MQMLKTTDSILHNSNPASIHELHKLQIKCAMHLHKTSVVSGYNYVRSF